MTVQESVASVRDNTPGHKPPAIVLSPADNVAVCRRNVHAGEILLMEGEEAVACTDVALGHKVARRFIPQGAEVFKYGMSIGSATADVQPGEWVHLHNLRSNYISTHTRQTEARS
ncbi:UxaA family hydrolase [Asticcacaulis sp. 201]|uniref:UxaA family hydrolase n=1 Tax=Asticcacaulis sp. 201 TaxID=3028787 RepID=UPI00291606F1|nr:UxaA family hydrolase [Asticcacaulis sp. 201]MDV6330691.1 UxaA family hydrolase [Asticcacaulis sp. 201]